MWLNHNSISVTFPDPKLKLLAGFQIELILMYRQYERTEKPAETCLGAFHLDAHLTTGSPHQWPPCRRNCDADTEEILAGPAAPVITLSSCDDPRTEQREEQTPGQLSLDTMSGHQGSAHWGAIPKRKIPASGMRMNLTPGSSSMCEPVFPLNALFPEQFPHHSLCLPELGIRPCMWEEICCT